MNKMYKKIVLDNGIRLYVHSDKTMRKTTFSYTVEYGLSGEFSNFNYDGKDYKVLPGCAHFLEHILLEHSKYGNLYVYFKTLKYVANASTGDIRTKYFFDGTRNIKSSIKKIIDALENPVFNEKDRKHSSHAIEEETKRGLNDPLWLTLRLNFRNLFNSFELCHESLSFIGTEETTKEIDSNMLRLCYNAYYSDDRKIITVAGPFDEDDMINHIKKIYSKINKHENKTKLLKPNELVSIRKKEDRLVSNTVEDPFLIFGFKYPCNDFSLFEINLFMNFISINKFGSKTKFYEDQKSKGILVSYYGAYQSQVYDNYFINNFIFIVKDIDKFTKAFDKQMKVKDFNKKDFELFKKDSISNYLYSTENKYAFYDALPENIVRYHKEIDYINEINKLSFDRFIKFYDIIDLDSKVTTIHTKEGLNNG